MSSMSDRAKAFSVEAILGILNEKTSEETGILKESNVLDEFYSLNRSTIQAELCSRDLWEKFHKIGTEMIITKAGRRMFPAIKILLNGLNKDTKYMIFMDIIPVDNRRYRFLYQSSEWIPAGNGDASCSRIYVHPDSPATGHFWMTQGRPIAFDKLKLTNNQNPVVNGQITLQSMHKYVPRILIVPNWNCDSQSVNPSHYTQSFSFIFPETSFITVTAYQNQQITKLKIASNPFAKGFRERIRHSRSYREEHKKIKQKKLRSLSSDRESLTSDKNMISNCFIKNSDESNFETEKNFCKCIYILRH